MDTLLNMGNGYKTAIGILLWVAGDICGFLDLGEIGEPLKNLGIVVGGLGVAHKAAKMG